ncbi:hypothetical protein JQ629_32340 [Bradyrhizobium sp. AUGA SZCCT0222]|uniref:hypothetical protein n=1 Tax=Bradyrhizobium sp. AUGA SZCCT0222 TaxID=2807668 RepID=UPI001BAC06D3|nr:hypothetical protein [Bradyrhizobium sp. AUGA SZCCT0222]MBR1272175.1 hypothetical protein [Bradyrhizobium sp. AUGA SZCCT0222]
MADTKETAKQMVKQSTNDAKVLAALLAQSEQFADVMSDLLVAEVDGSPEFERAMSDAKAHLISRKVELPSNARVTFTKNSPFTVTVCVNESCVSVTVKVQ